VHWRKSAAVGQLVTRERAREARPDIVLPLDVVRRDDAKDEWFTAFERRIRDIASRAVAHIKRGDAVTIKTTASEAVRGDRTTGADRLLRFLALVESITTSELTTRTANKPEPPMTPAPPPPRPATLTRAPVVDPPDSTTTTGGGGAAE
jgi:uncharacterized protein (DUF58 family)